MRALTATTREDQKTGTGATGAIYVPAARTTASDLAENRLDDDGGPALIAAWSPAVFLHYAVDPGVLQPRVPFPLDVRNGHAYVSVVAFLQRRLRPTVGGRLAEFLSRPLANHPFFNVRTYVTVDGEPGIYFLAEWIPNRLAAMLGPPLYGLPYRLGELTYDIGNATAVRCDVRAKCGAFRFRATDDRWTEPEPAPPDSLTEFLIERYTAFTMRGGTPLRFRIEHEPWLQVPLEVEVEDDTLLDATGAWRHHAYLVGANYSEGLRDVRIGPPRKLHPTHGAIARWAPLLLLPPLVGSALYARVPAWAFMWALAYAIFFGCKWAMMIGVGAARRRASAGRVLAYLFAWPGMDAKEFLAPTARANRPTSREWLAAIARPAIGVIVLFALARLFTDVPLLAGWIGMIGTILLLHFGVFHLIALALRRSGIAVTPLMNAPLRSRSVAEFWGTRWNLGFHKLADELVFRPLLNNLGVAGALMATFIASGLVHDLVITIPARGGYGLPTLYFAIQALAVLLERRIPRRRRIARRAFAMAVVGLPAFILFPPPFVLNVFYPFMRAIGAM